MKKYILFYFILFLMPFCIVNASNKVFNIDMDIFIDNYGNANVTETWSSQVNEGTEGYHPYYNLGGAYITDLNVSMDGKPFETIDEWDINSSFYEKANKAGIYRSGDELDICFGITDYGSHTYVVKYVINGFVVKLADSDMVYWNLFPKNFSASPDNINIKIHSDFKYESNLDVWGYGMKGAPCYVYDGIIEMTSNNKTIASDEYMTILVKFPSGTFNTSNIIDNEFDYYLNMSKEGAVSYTDKNSFWDRFSRVFSFFLNFFPFIVVGIIISIFSTAKSSSLDFGTTGNKVRKDVPNFREIPCNKDIFRAYWVSTNYNLNKKKEDFLGAILLKWIRNGNVSVEKVDVKKVFGTSVLNNIIFNHAPEEANCYEKRLYRWMYEASVDGKLEKNEFKKWCSTNYDDVFQWFDDVMEFENKMLVNDGKAQIINSGKLFVKTKYQIDSSMMIEAEQMAGLKKFLKEFTLIKEREPIEVNLWDEYLMYAQIFGIADEVASKFKKLYPELIEVMDKSGFDYDTLIFIHTFSSDGMSSASSAMSRARSYDSGGGGFSSGGGGSGSFGGGGGGGGFR